MAPHANGERNSSVVAPAATGRDLFIVNSPNVTYTEDAIKSTYAYHTTKVTKTAEGKYVAQPVETMYDFKVDRKIGKVGLMLVGWGGNNGSTVTAGIIANRRGLTWENREGKQKSNYYGSVIMGSTIKLGNDTETGEEIYIPFHDVLPMTHPNDLVIGGWDINSMNLADAMDRAAVLDPDLKRQVRDEMKGFVPLPSIYYPDFIAANQEGRANNLLTGTKQDHLEKIRGDIRSFKETNGLDKVIVLWTANTERYAEIIPGINDTADNLLNAIKSSHDEVSPSTVFAVASILEGVPFVNGSPQNTLVPGAIQLAEQNKAFIGGDDFKSGQTKMKSALVDFLVNAGIKLTSIASFNFLGNNDGLNLDAPQQFRSKEISKSNVVDDMVAANNILYEKDEHPNHTVVIKYMPAVGDHKRAMDEYYAEIFMGGHQSISMTNICEDSLLASPLIIDLAILAELMTRISWKSSFQGVATKDYKGFHSVLSILSYMLKAPCVPPGTPVINSLAKQRAAMSNIFRACVGLAPESDMTLEHKLFA
ncbi:hypothetical protein BDD12DRAFT_800524 [Trichophaea hybrida]|nr:hypothetical protein BDD12DRAFT_800524 [Trichophaea hybrida]